MKLSEVTSFVSPSWRSCLGLTQPLHDGNGPKSQELGSTRHSRVGLSGLNQDHLQPGPVDWGRGHTWPWSRNKIHHSWRVFQWGEDPRSSIHFGIGGQFWCWQDLDILQLPELGKLVSASSYAKFVFIRHPESTIFIQWNIMVYWNMLSSLTHTHNIPLNVRSQVLVLGHPS